MAERWERERDRDRGFVGRATDEVRSWFGGEGHPEGRGYDERGWRDREYRQDYARDYPSERWSGREGMRDAGGDYRTAGETALGRPDWGNREGTYQDRDRFWRGSQEARSRTPYSGPVYWNDRYTHVNYTGIQPGSRFGGADYAGIGPRGYRRSDQRVLEDVCDRLTEDSRVNAGDIEVKCHDGVVTLTGSVQSRDEKRLAEDIAESVPGIHDVNNNLRVSSGVIGSPGAPQTPLGLSSPGGESRHAANAETEPAKRR